MAYARILAFVLNIRRCTIAELAASSNLADALAEYASESGMPEIGEPGSNIAVYEPLEATGKFHSIAAFEDDRLVGYLFFIVNVLPHYLVPTAVVESFFVLKAERPKGVGMKLMKLAEDIAAEFGASAILISAPVGSSLSQMLSLSKTHRHSNNVFVKALS